MKCKVELDESQQELTKPSQNQNLDRILDIEKYLKIKSEF